MEYQTVVSIDGNVGVIFCSNECRISDPNREAFSLTLERKNVWTGNFLGLFSRTSFIFFREAGTGEN